MRACVHAARVLHAFGNFLVTLLLRWRILCSSVFHAALYAGGRVPRLRLDWPSDGWSDQVGLRLLVPC